VQAAHASCRLDDIARTLARRQAVAPGQPGSALGDADPPHRKIVPAARVAEDCRTESRTRANQIHSPSREPFARSGH
jgi:hypothetical protein